MRVEERRRLLDPETVEYRFRVDDPASYARPFSGRLRMRRTRAPIFEYACHEGNDPMRHMLEAARAAQNDGADPG